jgi:hypothetical protein
MNAKRAKRLRKLASAEVETNNDSLYEIDRKGTITLRPLSTKGIYRGLKRLVKHWESSLKGIHK